MQKKGYTYILFNKKNGTLYVGVTSDLKNRVMQHKEKVYDGFTKKIWRR
nr:MULTISPECIES: GIY-YIG nuclease family protein [unclassified Fibrobacter]